MKTKRKKRTKTKTKRKVKKLELSKRLTLRYLSNRIVKSKHIRVEFKKRDEVAYRVPSQIPVIIKPPILMKDMSS